MARPATPQDVLLGFNDMAVYQMDPCHCIIQDISGFIRKRGVTAVLGASSAGKTVLMKALCGRLGTVPNLAVSGEVVLDGRPLADFANKPINHLSYVPQSDDSLIGVLSARQLLTYAALLKTNLTGQALADHVGLILEKLGLTEHADKMIGTIYKRGLSGGQKRRVTVGVDLVSNPACLFLDEPTSGLDTSTAIATVGNIKQIVQNSTNGLGAMISVHQPSNELLAHVDDILVLSGGRCVFFG